MPFFWIFGNRGYLIKKPQEEITFREINTTNKKDTDTYNYVYTDIRNDNIGQGKNLASFPVHQQAEI